VEGSCERGNEHSGSMKRWEVRPIPATCPAHLMLLDFIIRRRAKSYEAPHYAVMPVIPWCLSDAADVTFTLPSYVFCSILVIEA
jgi:hypothetical protein